MDKSFEEAYAAEAQEGKNFSYSFGLVLSCLGCVLGTGNIWRFPRIVAIASSESGVLLLFFLFIVCAPEPAVQPVETSQCALNGDHLCIMSRNARKSCNGSTGKAGQGSQPHLYFFTSWYSR